jgi:Ger(x)C family germination protein
LEPILRNRGTPMTMKVALADGKVSELFQKEKTGLLQTVDHVIKEVKNGEVYTHIPKNSLQKVMTFMMDSGRDFGLPLFRKNGDRIEEYALALFHGTTFTGETLSIPDSTLLTLLNGEKGRFALLTQEGEEGKLALFIKRVTQQKKITEKDGGIIVRLESKMSAILAQGIKRLSDDEQQSLEQKLSQDLTKRAEGLLKKIQKANCDFLGIGREMNAYHHDLWSKLDWEKEYPRIVIEPRVQLEIVNTGILN